MYETCMKSKSLYNPCGDLNLLQAFLDLSCHTQKKMRKLKACKSRLPTSTKEEDLYLKKKENRVY